MKLKCKLAEGILDELKMLNPKDESGRRKTGHHQFLTDDVGNPRDNSDEYFRHL